MFPSYKNVPLGTFEVISGRMAACDPCYKTKDWCRGVLENVKKGTWEACILTKDCKQFGLRVVGIKVKHVYASNPIRIDDTHEAGFHVYVDSGQAGFFDEQHYGDNSLIDSYEHAYGEPWYNKCCDITLGENMAGVIPYGAVSRSGFGDGEYECRVKTDENGEIDYARIEFMQ